MNSAAPASRAARSIASASASGSANAMLARDGVAEEERVLEHDADRAAQVAEPRASRTSTPSIEHAPCVDVVEARDSRATVDLPLPVAPDERDGLPGADARGRARRAPVGRSRRSRTHALEADLAAALGRQRRRRAVRAESAIAGSVDEHLVRRARPAADRTLALGDDHAEHAQRPDQQHDVDVEGDELAERQVAVEHLVAAEAEHGDQAEVGQQLERGQVAGADPGGPQRARRRRRRPRRGAGRLHAPRRRSPSRRARPRRVSSTTVASSADSAWTASTAGWMRAEKRLASDVDERQRPSAQQRQQRVRWRRRITATRDDQGQRSTSSAGSSRRRPGSAGGRCWPGSSAGRSAPGRGRRSGAPGGGRRAARAADARSGAPRGRRGSGARRSGSRPTSPITTMVSDHASSEPWPSTAWLMAAPTRRGTAILVPLQSRPTSPPRAMPRFWAASVARSRRQPSRRPLAVTRLLCSPSSAAGRRPDVPTPRRGYRRGSATTQAVPRTTAGPS